MWSLLTAATALLAIAVQGVGAQAPSPGVSPTQADRQALAAHAVGINFAFMEAQRAGAQAADSEALFPSLWSWKQPAYTNPCTEVLAQLDPADAAKVNLKDYIGYFEAGNAVTVTGIMGFVAVQRALGALVFMSQMEAQTPRESALGDPAMCLTGGYTTSTLKDLYMREMRHMANVMENSILKSTADGSDFKILIGVADTQTFGAFAPPSWDTPPNYQEICYVGDMENPAADIAASVASALAISAKVARDFGSPEDAADADRWEMLAERAFNYAKKMTHEHADKATCTVSSTATNCIGSGCSASGLEEGTNNTVRGTCTLYENLKPPRQHLWVAAAALYYTTGSPYYRAEADYLWDRTFATFLFNWNNVPAQGLIIMNLAPDLPGAEHNKTYYQTELAEGASFWTQCSEEGQVDFQGYVFCRKTPDGSAYPLDFPWGNLGSITNGLCLSAVYQQLNFDAPDSPARAGNRCFMQEQIGYLFNHKCSTPGSSCNTNGTEGFSYMVGMGKNYPTRLHSRDAAFPNFDLTVLGEPDGNLMCGAMAPGPYAGGGNEVADGPVLEGTDAYLNDRRRWRESEPALDTTGGLICALMGYAALPEGSMDSCPAARTAFTGQG